MLRKCFYSFHYVPDCQRVAQIRQIGSIEGNKPASDNNWETVRGKNKSVIEKWISDQMHGRSCTIVLVGSDTANRPWINHEIVKSWDDGMGVVGIYIHGIKNLSGETVSKGNNPFDYIYFGNSKTPLSSVVKCYNPVGTTSQQKYAWISEHLSNAVEEAIQIRKKHP